MKVGVAKETAPGETRVAVVPDTARRLADQDVETLVEQGAGEQATFADSAYEEVGARVVTADELYREADVVCKVRKPSPEEVERLREGQALVALLQPLVDPEIVQTLARRGVTAFSMDVIPRVTRAQPMDALSSQSTISGYKAAILAAEHLGKFFPMLTTAAGTIPPAKVLVLGAGVAGLQAIATARRLGAVVSAFDVRPVVKEQVESLGASFLELDVEGAEGVGGYAVALAEDQHAREQELIARHAAESDAVITTALIPGRPAPELITEDAVRGMRAGLGHRRPRRRGGWKLRRHEAGRDDRERRRHRRGPHKRARHHAGAREPDVLAQRPRVPRTAHQGRRARARLRGRDRARHVRRPRRPRDAGGERVSQALLTSITVFVLAVFLGFELISRVPTLLHTPLMSGTNAIHGIILVGAMLIAGSADSDLEKVLAFVAVVFGTINVVGGFLVTDRMLEMFKRKPAERDE